MFPPKSSPAYPHTQASCYVQTLSANEPPRFLATVWICQRTAAISRDGSFNSYSTVTSAVFEFLVLVHHDTTDVGAFAHCVVSLVDALKVVSLRDQAIEVQKSFTVKVEELWNVSAWVT